MKNIYVNLPVNDIKKSSNFFQQLGFSLDPQMSSDNSANIRVEQNFFIMLHTKAKFQEFAKKNIADSTKLMASVVALSLGSKEEVDDIYQKAIGTGGKEALETQDYGFMYMRTFEDLDGHVWEIFWKK